MNTSRKFRIIWSVDAFPEKKEDFKQAIKILNNLGKSDVFEIIPTYVFNLTDFYEESDRLETTELQGSLSEYVKAARYQLNRLLEPIHKVEFRKPVIVTHSNSSVTDNVKELEKFAKKAKADLILVSSHARKGMARFLLGSFAETLLLESQVPVMVVNPKTNVPSKIKKIFFSSDFSKESREAFLKVCSLAQRLNASVTIYHKFIDRITPTLAAGTPFFGGQFQNNPKKRNQDLKRIRKSAESFKELARKLNVSSKIKIDVQDGSVSDGVLFHSKGHHLIAMTSRSSKTMSTLVGSLCRKIVRSSALPTWVIHPKNSADKEKKRRSIQRSSESKSLTLYS